ncbi:MAG: hypothetical protein II260_03455 [Muribaculaceae bacterium]|nr:hypothetical protein [Muribaculaceae bacterium]
MRQRIILILGMAMCAASYSFACTSAIISAKASKTGRPLLWKNRDTGTEHNFVEKVEAKDGNYAYVALYNGGDSTLRDAWLGMNEVGFAIMNTASYNLAPDTAKLKDQEGYVMSLALKKCRTLADFETLLDTISKPMGVQANFGMIDATGDGAYYETNDYTYTKFSLSDAEDGVLVRTNYSYTGEEGGGYGYIREDNAWHLLEPYIKNKSIEASTFTDEISRSFYHSLKDRDVAKGEDRWIVDQDYIPRRTTSASVVMEGILPDEDPSLYMMWTEIGYPPCSYTLPVMIDYLPQELRPQGKEWRSQLCNEIIEKKHKVFSIKRGSGKHYIDMNAIRAFSIEGKKRSLENYKKGYKMREEKAKQLKK